MPQSTYLMHSATAQTTRDGRRSRSARRRSCLVTAAAAFAFGLLASVNYAQSIPNARAQPSAPAEGASGSARNTGKPMIVLVHGGPADATGWQHVIRILERNGYTILTVQNPLDSFAGDVQTTKRFIDAQDGPVVAVGHLFGGAVITAAAAGNANVRALVYVATFAPEADEPIGAYNDAYPSSLGTALGTDAAGFVYIDRTDFPDRATRDVSTAEASVTAATRKPVSGNAFGTSVEPTAWNTIPSWYRISRDDRAINPNLDRFYAKRMAATTTEIKSSHVPFISHPEEVARLIEQVATAVVK